MDIERIATWKPGIKITDLKKGDIIYIRKVINDYDYHYECRLVSFTGGIITGEIVRCDRNYGKHESGETITARLTKCYLWGKDETDRWAFCRWFTKTGETK